MTFSHKNVISIPGIRERIATRAYELYEARGSVHGFALQDWLDAKQEVFGTIPTSTLFPVLFNAAGAPELLTNTGAFGGTLVLLFP